MIKNSELIADSVTRRSILRKSAAIGTLLVASGAFASSASAQRGDLITVEPETVFMGRCDDEDAEGEFEVSLSRGRGKTAVEISGIVEESFTLGGPNPDSETVTVGGPNQPSFGEIIVTATRGANEDQVEVTQSCLGTGGIGTSPV